MMYHTFFQSVVSQVVPDLFTGETFTISGTTNVFNIDVVTSNLYNPQTWYHNGNTYCATRESHNAPGRLGKVGILKYANQAVSHQYMSADPDQTFVTNYHDNPTLAIFGGEGSILHQQHDGVNVETWHANDVSNLAGFTNQGLSAQIGNYPKVSIIDQGSGSFKAFVVGRRKNASDGNRGLWVHESTDLINWTNGYQVTVPAGLSGESDIRHYPIQVQNQLYNGWHHFNFLRRTTVSGSATFKKSYIMKTQDFDTWYNLSETFSKNARSSGMITDTELENCLFANYPAGLPLERFHVIGSDGNYVVYYNDQFHIDSGSGFTTYDLALSGNPRTYFIRRGKKYVLTIVDENRIDLLEIANDFQSVLSTTQVASNADGVFNLKLPMNYNDIPEGQRFVAAYCTLKNGNSNVISGTEQNDIVCLEMLK